MPDTPHENINVCKAPQYKTIKGLCRLRDRLGGPALVEIKVPLKTITPVLGGATRPQKVDDEQEVDEVDGIRAPTVRGHLRFWWRALHGHQYETSQKLYEAESALWGRAAGRGIGGRSLVEIMITSKENKKIETYKLSKNDFHCNSFYALWPARADELWRPGVCFTLSILCPQDREKTIKNVVRAWILFGGYGGRTRRGVGSLTVDGEPTDWLPDAKTHANLRSALETLFETDIFAPLPGKLPTDVPLLRGAELSVGEPSKSEPKAAWTTAIGWLKEFRQGAPPQDTTSPEDWARQRGDNQRPGRSNWPEADKVRQNSLPRGGLPWAHGPKHSPVPAWPRGGFGLPILGQFQKENRNGVHWEKSLRPCTEPGNFQLQLAINGEKCDRLASPLIVKALPLANGEFLPCALWLNRAYPKNGEIVLVRNDKMTHPAPFDRLVAPKDTPHFKPLKNKASLKDAFMGWLIKPLKNKASLKDAFMGCLKAWRVAP